MLFFFYLFSFFIASSAFFAVTNKNPVHSVLYLVVTFVSAGALFILLQAEFIAMVLIVVYVGAIAVLFLFIVMMLPQQTNSSKSLFSKNSTLMFFVCLFVLFLHVDSWEVMPRFLIWRPPITANFLGRVLYTDYVYIFQLCGVILLVAMVSSVSLALHKTRGVKRQLRKRQLQALAKVDLVDVKSGSGVDF